MIDDVFARARRGAQACIRVPPAECPRPRPDGPHASRCSRGRTGDGRRRPSRSAARLARVAAQASRSSASPAPAAPARSSLTDELLARLVQHFPERADRGRRDGSDPPAHRRRAARRPHPHEQPARRAIFMRSLATRRQHLATRAMLKDVIELYQAGWLRPGASSRPPASASRDTEIVDLVDLSLYVMTSEFGAASQLEKIDMLDFAELIVLNKCDKRGAEDALRDVRKQWRRNHPSASSSPMTRCRCIPTIASRFNDPGREPDVREPLPALGKLPGADAGAGTARSRHRPELSRARAADPGRSHPLSRRDRPAGRAASARASRHRRRRRGAPTALYEALKALHDARCPRRSSATAAAARGARPRMPRGASCAPRYNRALDELGAEASASSKAWPRAGAVGHRRDLQPTRCASAR